MDIWEPIRPQSNHLVGGFCKGHYILWCEKIHPSAKKSLFNAAPEQLAQLIRHEPILFQAVDVSPDGLPEGQFPAARITLVDFRPDGDIGTYKWPKHDWAWEAEFHRAHGVEMVSARG